MWVCLYVCGFAFMCVHVCSWVCGCLHVCVCAVWALKIASQARPQAVSGQDGPAHEALFLAAVGNEECLSHPRCSPRASPPSSASKQANATPSASWPLAADACPGTREEREERSKTGRGEPVTTEASQSPLRSFEEASYAASRSAPFSCQEKHRQRTVNRLLHFPFPPSFAHRSTSNATRRANPPGRPAATKSGISVLRHLLCSLGENKKRKKKQQKKRRLDTPARPAGFADLTGSMLACVQHQMKPPSGLTALQSADFPSLGVVTQSLRQQRISIPNMTLPPHLLSVILSPRCSALQDRDDFGHSPPRQAAHPVPA